MTDRSDPSPSSHPPPRASTSGSPTPSTDADSLEPGDPPAHASNDTPAVPSFADPAKFVPPPIALTEAEITAARQASQRPKTRPAGELPVRGPEATPTRGSAVPSTPSPGAAGSNDGAPRKPSESQRLRVATVERLLPPHVDVTAHPNPEREGEVPDEKLVLRSMDGDNLAFEELYRRYLSRAVVAAYAVLGQREKAQDVAQEAFIESANKLATLREPENFGGWVCGISRRMAIVAIRKESRRLNAIRDHQEELREKPRHDEPDIAAVKDEQKALIRRAIELVPAKYREILLLKYVEKLSYDDIASMCAISRAAVDKRLTRGKKILREKMEELMGKEGGLM
ncbi:MAG TPA: sigma-70 family RNA polymerase sigma factor [Planctomycetota bacterium]|nr:sigma-70 family RNA polymerase sigma factor [Planctomycetota bacterium]